MANLYGRNVRRGGPTTIEGTSVTTKVAGTTVPAFVVPTRLAGTAVPANVVGTAVPASVVKTMAIARVVPTRFVETAVPTIIVETAYYWKSCCQGAPKWLKGSNPRLLCTLSGMKPTLQPKEGPWTKSNCTGSNIIRNWKTDFKNWKTFGRT